MKRNLILGVSALVLIAATYSSCKKEIAAVDKSTLTVKEDELASKIALSLYKSLSAQVTTNTLVPAGNNLLRVMSSNPDCGKAETTFTDKTEKAGDTTRVFKGKSVFTLMCDGYFNNGWNVDAYTLYDSLYVTEKGTGFDNYSSNVQNLVVKTLDSRYAFVSVGGTLKTFSHTSKQNGQGVTTAYYDLGTQYKLNDLKIKTGSGQFEQGDVEFAASNTFKDATTGADGFFGNYSGYIRFLNENKAKVFFKNGEGSYTRYELNLKTGEMGKPVKNVPFE